MVLKCLFFVYWCGKVWHNKKAKSLSKEEIKKKLLDSVTIDEVAEFDDLNKEVEEIQVPEKAAEIIKRMKTLLK